MSNLYHRVAYGAGPDIRFTVRANSDAEAIAYADTEAKRIFRMAVFIETKIGVQIYDNVITQS